MSLYKNRAILQIEGNCVEFTTFSVVFYVNCYILTSPTIILIQIYQCFSIFIIIFTSHYLAFFTNKIQNVLDNIINLTMLLINKFQIKLTTNLLTNNYINIKFISNKLFILNNPSNINITKLLTKNNITYKII